MADDHQGDDSLFEQFMAQAVPVLTLELPDGENIARWTIAAVDSDGVIDLDDFDHPLDVVEALVGEDLADEILDALATLPWDDTLAAARSLRRHFSLAELPTGMWSYLVQQVDLYGEEIETDLAEYRSTDLLDYFRGARPWQQLARALPRLPEGSRYAAALLNDEELAAERLEQDDDAPSGSDRPPLIGETQDRALLRSAVSLLRKIEHATYAAQAPKNKRGKAPDPLKGPETALDRIRDAVGDAEVEEIFDQVIPGWNKGEGVPDGFRMTLTGLLVPDDN